jgi:hypothetical protein
MGVLRNWYSGRVGTFDGDSNYSESSARVVTLSQDLLGFWQESMASETHAEVLKTSRCAAA